MRGLKRSAAVTGLSTCVALLSFALPNAYAAPSPASSPETLAVQSGSLFVSNTSAANITASVNGSGSGPITISNMGSIDGTRVPDRHIKRIELPKDPVTICLASDGYPQLFDNFEKTERALRNVIAKDPLMIAAHPETKGVYLGQSSFDDRTYVKLTV